MKIKLSILILLVTYSLCAMDLKSGLNPEIVSAIKSENIDVILDVFKNLKPEAQTFYLSHPKLMPIIKKMFEKLTDKEWDKIDNILPKEVKDAVYEDYTNKDKQKPALKRVDSRTLFKDKYAQSESSESESDVSSNQSIADTVQEHILNQEEHNSHADDNNSVDQHNIAREITPVKNDAETHWFNNVPVRIATGVGALSSVAAFVYGRTIGVRTREKEGKEKEGQQAKKKKEKSKSAKKGVKTKPCNNKA